MTNKVPILSSPAVFNTKHPCVFKLSVIASWLRPKTKTSETMTEQTLLIKSEETILLGIQRKMGEYVGFRFHPTEQEIISYFLEMKMRGLDFPVHTITEVDICKLEPWDLPQRSPLPPDDLVWYFFNVPVYKYARGKPMMERTTGTGFWKVTGNEREIRDKHGENKIGFKRNLVFYSGRAPNAIKTNWVMHEYHSKNATRYQKEYILFRLKRKSRDTSDSCNQASRHLASNPGTEVASATQVNHDLSEEYRLILEEDELVPDVLSALLSTLPQEQRVSHRNGFVNECNPRNSHLNATEQDNTFVDSLWAEQTLLHATNPSKPLTGVFAEGGSVTDIELDYVQAQMLESGSLLNENASTKEYRHKPMVPVFYETSSSSDSERYKAENRFFDEIVDSDTEVPEINCLELVVDEFSINTTARKSQYIPKSHGFMEKKCAPQELHLQTKALRGVVSNVKAREAAAHAIDLPKTENSIVKFGKDQKIVQTSNVKTGLKVRSNKGDSSNRKGSSTPLDHKNSPPSVYVGNMLVSLLLIIFFVREMMYLH